MNNIRKAAERMLEVFDPKNGHSGEMSIMEHRALGFKVAREMRAALAESQPEPVAWIEQEWSGTGARRLTFERRSPSLRDEVVNPIWTPLYTHPPREWKGLTEDEIEPICQKARDDAETGWPYGPSYVTLVIRGVEAALKEKNQ